MRLLVGVFYVAASSAITWKWATAYVERQRARQDAELKRAEQDDAPPP